MSAKDFAEQHDGQQVEIDNRPGEGPFIVRGYTSPDRVVMEAPASWKRTSKGFNLTDLGRRSAGVCWTGVVPAPGSDTRFVLRGAISLTIVASAVGAAYAAAPAKPFHQQFAEQYDGQQVMITTSMRPRIVRGYCVNQNEILLEVPGWSGLTNVGYALAQVTDPLHPVYSTLTSRPIDPRARFSTKYPKSLMPIATTAVQVQQATAVPVNMTATVNGVPEHVQFFNDHADEEVEIRSAMGTRRLKARVIGYGTCNSRYPAAPVILLDTYGFVGPNGILGATLHDTIRRKVLEDAVLSPGANKLDTRKTMTVMREVADITLIQHVIACGTTGGRSITPIMPGGASMQHPSTPVDRVTRDSMLRQVFCGPPAPKPKQIDEYPGSCPRCRGPAYVSALTVDCKAHCH